MRLFSKGSERVVTQRTVTVDKPKTLKEFLKQNRDRLEGSTSEGLLDELLRPVDFLKKHPFDVPAQNDILGCLIFLNSKHAPCIIDICLYLRTECTYISESKFLKILDFYTRVPAND